MTAPSDLVREIVEQCWSDADGLARMGALVAPSYVHHTPWGEWTFEQFGEGLAYVGTIFTDRTYRVVHLVTQGDPGAVLVAAFLTWTATRVTDGSRVEGTGAYHCRVVDGLVHEDWDVFAPMS